VFSSYLFLAIALNVLANALRFGVQVGFVIGVQKPLCLGLTAF
jgi:S-adenosylmethionine synthetase